MVHIASQEVIQTSYILDLRSPSALGLRSGFDGLRSKSSKAVAPMESSDTSVSVVPNRRSVSRITTLVRGVRGRIENGSSIWAASSSIPDDGAGCSRRIRHCQSDHSIGMYGLFRV